MRSLRFALLLAALTALPAHCAEVVVGAPRELTECVDALSAEFLADEKNVHLRFVTDNSEKLYEKVSAGAPLDVYMSSHMALQGQLLAAEKWCMTAGRCTPPAASSCGRSTSASTSARARAAVQSRPETRHRQRRQSLLACFTDRHPALHGKPNPAAYRFVRFLKTAKTQAILTPKGFMKPPLEAVNVR